MLHSLGIVQLLIYEKIKYHDDGFEKVTATEFISIHITFPVTNAWISYTLGYILLINLANYCNYDILYTSLNGCIPAVDNVCPNSREAVCGSVTSNGSEIDPTVFYQSLFTWPSMVVLCILTAEAAMNLAYYKDFIFALVVGFNFVCMWLQNFVRTTQTASGLPALYKCLIGLFVITSILGFGTLLFHFKSAFLRKGEYYEKSIRKIKEKREEQRQEEIENV